ncbi:hypothetical protein ABZ896_17235 [Streptomyces sp. NPDC047072]|uniref:hypothetical protein n=1 Tax=Streptomyces sp. NPDC047072 TaxID=3154809 RepID=UPI0033E6197E
MELTTELLRTMPPQDLAAHLPVAVGIGDGVGVILGLADPEQLEVFYAGRISLVSTHVLEITPVVDCAKQLDAVRTAVEALVICRRVALEAHTEQEQRHHANLDAIRQYAIERHQNGDICSDGLDAFLEEFGMKPYVERVRVRYTITGSYEVAPGDEDAVRNDAEQYLGPNLSGLDDVDDYSVDFTLTIDEITEV